MKLTDSIKRIFLTEDSRRAAMESRSAPTAADEEGEAAEWKARREQARNEVLRAIKEEGVYWP